MLKSESSSEQNLKYGTNQRIIHARNNQQTKPYSNRMFIMKKKKKKPLREAEKPKRLEIRQHLKKSQYEKQNSHEKQEESKA